MNRAATPMRLALAVLIAGGQPSSVFARELAQRDFAPVAFTILDEEKYACTPGIVKLPANAFAGQMPGSPAPSVAPTHNSLNLAPSVWGLGWHEATDATLRLEPDGRVLWTDGQGSERAFAPLPIAAGSLTLPEDPALLDVLLRGGTVQVSAGLVSNSPPLYRSPVGTFDTLVYSSGTNNVPTELRLESLSGEKTTFKVFESTAILRPSLMTDRNGSTLSYERDAQGRLIKVEDVHGRFTQVAYDGQGRVQTLTDQANRTVTYGYDGQGRKTSENGFNGPTTYQYDGSSARIERVIYPNSSFRRYEYNDPQGRVTLEESNNGVDRLTYVYESTRTLITDALGETTIHEFKNVNGARRIAKIIDAKGGETVMDYDSDLNMTRREDPEDNVTTYVYDDFGNPTQVTAQADNAVTNTVYNGPFRQPSLVTDPRNIQTSFGYSTPKGDLTSVTTPDGATSMSHDPFGHVTNSDPPGVPATTFGYDSATGALNLVTDPLGRPTQMTRDSLSRVTRNTDPKGKITDFTYDDAGNLLTVKEYIGGQTLTTTYGYENGRTSKLLHTVQDAKGHTTTFDYDTLGRIERVTDAEGNQKNFTYDAKSRLATSQDANGNLISFTYDELDRLTLKDRPDGDVSYTYDDNGNLTSVTNPNGSVVMSYDGRDRLEEVTQTLPGGGQYTLTYTYDKNGNRTSMGTPWGTFLYTYDAMNRLDLMTVPASLGAPARTFDFDYDAVGRRSKLTYPNNTEAVYTYDNASQVTEIKHKLQTSTHALALAQYTYDLAGNRTTMTDLNGTHFYGYDELHRATAAVHPPASSLPIRHEVFTYDAVGNRLADARATGYAYDDANRLLSDSLFTYENDDNGNRTAKVERAGGDRTDYTYDSENQLVGISNATGTFVYKFDGLGRRHQISWGNDADEKIQFIFNDEQILAMLDGESNLIAFYGAAGMDESLMLRTEDGADLFMSDDLLGSVVAHSDSNGAVVERIEFETFGLPTFLDLRSVIPSISAESFTDSKMAFTGREWDSPVSQLHYRSRSMDPIAGRFLRADSVGISGGINLYAYVENNPHVAIDPMGRGKIKAIKYAIGAWDKIIGKHLVGSVPKGSRFSVNVPTIKKLIRRGLDPQNFKGNSAGGDEIFEMDFGRQIGTRKGTTGIKIYRNPSLGITSAHPIKIPGAHLGAQTATLLGLPPIVGFGLDFFNPLSDAQDMIDIASDLMFDEEALVGCN